MKYFYTVCLVFAAYLSLWAQPHDLHPCGTMPEKSQWLKEYQRNPALFAADIQLRQQNTTYLPISLHLVGKSDSSALIPLTSVLTSFCQLNEDYAQTNIQFYIQYPIHYHYNDSWYVHNTVYEGGAMMLQENIANTINVYFVSSAAGNCGYNLPYAGVAMASGCLFGHTFAHEIGHALALPHTFLGWEGGQTHTGTVAPDYNTPAPLIVTYDYTDFKDTRWTTDTLIIDSAYVENVARTGNDKNCHFAADGFCDTPADYLAFRWACSANNAQSTQTQIDPTGISFQSDGWNIMSYAHDACQVGFSPEQIAAMHAFIQQNRQDYIPTQTPNYSPIIGTPNLIYPAQNDTIPAENPVFRWNAIPNATHYILEVYREPIDARIIIANTVVQDTFFEVNSVLPLATRSFPYAWRIRPFNAMYTCGNFSDAVQFRTHTPVNINEVITQDWQMQIHPNPISNASGFHCAIHTTYAQEGQLNIYNSLGQRILMQNMDLHIGENNQYISSSIFNHQKGLFLVQWQGNNGHQKTMPLIVE